MNPRYPAVAAKASHRCEYCHAPEVMFNFPFEVEHIIPTCRGGGDIESNLALSCRSCNLRKGVQISGCDPLKQNETAYYDPRTQVWNDHFSVEFETGEILGLTATGRATVAALDMNSAAQVAARQQWKRLELFP